MRDQNDRPVTVDFGYNPPRIYNGRSMMTCVAISRDERNCFVGQYNETLMAAINNGWDFYTIQYSFLNNYGTLHEGVM